ncbi:geranylgeranyltransferase type-1 subunit alpha [Seminavis robusta]|uniref:Protein farnesyltransferase/geranylgeranyltransferase type-1 subunit alpha n=1 Tax=Seminavis robusta TaxID=568900 RepID=A0A9N8H5S4_9STRA|nr:geranylgeranyltransferase type-1 subunit alpha [Seminavis robusta]|eukprot:Sro93_g048740.1 geranylgeranyltransferase type-1 subunit alpha (347) ;mRNA; f:117165-118424
MMMLSNEELPSLFSDLTPIKQDDGPNPVCAIDYSPQFIQAYDYMRAILSAGEKSERALRLTGLCLKLNPANYTIWHFRRQCLLATHINEEEGKDDSSNNNQQWIQQDLELAATLGGDNPKNYQIWYHRRALLESVQSRIPYVQAELDYVAKVLDEDSKNYHAWSHRQWVVRTSSSCQEDLWDKELEFAHSMIQKDPRNNSAWNQRWFVCHKGGEDKTLSLEVATKEADYAIQGAGLDPYNESPWRYLIGVIKEQCKILQSADKDKFLDDYDQKAFGLRAVLDEAGKDPNDCASLASARIDILEFKGGEQSLEKAMELANGLATQYDPIRKKYWNLRVSEMKQVLAK